MGYTNYWDQHRDFTDQEWATMMKCADWVVQEADRRGVVLRGWDGTSVPKVTTSDIGFNGNGDTGDDYETFLLEKKQAEKDNWTSQEDYNREGATVFCKTAKKPYDAVVVAMLVIAKTIAPNALDIRSDGGDEVFNLNIDPAVRRIIKRGTKGEIKLPEPVTEDNARFAMMDL